MELFCVTEARAPIAVELLTAELAAAKAPSSVSLPPIGFEVSKSALLPTKVLRELVVVFMPASRPIKEFEKPLVLDKPAPSPKKQLKKPSWFWAPAPSPKKELAPPVFALPALMPANTLAVPTLHSTRLPPMLYCVAALITLPDKVPPDVPLPEMLKLLPACCEVVF